MPSYHFNIQISAWYTVEAENDEAAYEMMSDIDPLSTDVDHNYDDWELQNVTNEPDDEEGGLEIESMHEDRNDSAREAVLEIFKEIRDGAREGNDMGDVISDELGEYWEEVDSSRDNDLISAYGLVRDTLDDGPEDQAFAASKAINMLEPEEGGFEVDEELQRIAKLAGI